MRRFETDSLAWYFATYIQLVNKKGIMLKMSAILKITHRDKNKEELICTNVMTIGRDKSSTVCLNDPLVSRNHGIIRSIGKEQYYLLDTGSRNGIYHNSRRISSPVLLKNNDTVTIGDNTVCFMQDKAIPEETQDLTNTASDFAETMHVIRADIRSVIVLVSDIRDFTAISENLPIKTLTELMSTWFEGVQDIIENNSGIVDKFMGDCVLAEWEVESGDTESLFQALQTTVEINKFTASLHSKFKKLKKPLKIGVGLNQGDAVVGIGSDNTIMGDVVNTAFRLESASKEIGADVIMNSNFYRIMPDNFPVKDERTIIVKGKALPLTVSALSFKDIELFLAANIFSVKL
ncbi:MAG: FHA domain-containing protein [Proteobacteria bacterium]|nr:FHA domain-containing protein [Pseudomonadota bacterium]